MESRERLRPLPPGGVTSAGRLRRSAEHHADVRLTQQASAPTWWQRSPGHLIDPYARSVTSVEEELRNLRQLAWSMIPGGMSLVAASFFGSSWYLAERIRSEACVAGRHRALGRGGICVRGRSHTPVDRDMRIGSHGGATRCAD